MHQVTDTLGKLVALTAIAVPLSVLAAATLEQGIQFGDVTAGRAIIWSRSDRPSRMMIQWALDSDFTRPRTIAGPYATPASDFTVKQDVTGLPSGKDIYIKVWFEDQSADRSPSEPFTGQFRTIGKQDNIRFVWGGDTAGQGWGINEAFGGMKIYEAMRRTKPLFFIHSGDTVYSDIPIPETAVAENDRIWTNRVTPEVRKVAETLDEFRGRYKYNLLDDNLRRFNAEVPQIWQWDDHEVVNNWSKSKDLGGDSRYTIKDVPLLRARATQAFHEYAPLRPPSAEEPERIYRRISYGDLLDVFVLDMRSYRGPNSHNRQPVEGPDTAFLGESQLSWLEQELAHSPAVWKVIAADMPIGLNISDDFANNPPQRWEAIANGDDGLPAGRELEIARLLSFLKQRHINNVVWLTADVHYAAAHHYDPGKAATDDFLPFWEFIAGPLNAGTFGPNNTDGTFGPQVVFKMTRPPGKTNLSPYAGLQFFGEVNIDRQTETMTVDLKNIDGETVFRKTLSASQDSDVERR